MVTIFMGKVLGSKDDTGILPRFTDTLFTSDTAVMKASAQCYMLELYQVLTRIRKYDQQYVAG